MKSSVLKCGELRGCRSGEERKWKTEEEKGAREKLMCKGLNLMTSLAIVDVEGVE